jgi:hypothetical protein
MPNGVGATYLVGHVDLHLQRQTVDAWIAHNGLNVPYHLTDAPTQVPGNGFSRHSLDFQQLWDLIANQAIQYVVILSEQRLSIDHNEFHLLGQDFRWQHIEIWSASDDACLR